MTFAAPAAFEDAREQRNPPAGSLVEALQPLERGQGVAGLLRRQRRSLSSLCEVGSQLVAFLLRRRVCGEVLEPTARLAVNPAPASRAGTAVAGRAASGSSLSAHFRIVTPPGMLGNLWGPLQFAHFPQEKWCPG